MANAVTMDPRRVVGRLVLRWATQVGRVALFSFELLRGLKEWKQWLHPAMRQAQDIGYGSLFIVLITASFAGAVTALQAGYQLTAGIPVYFAAGNLLRPIETSGVVGREGEAAGRAMAAALAGQLDAPARRVPVKTSPPLRYVTPQVIAIPGDRPDGLLFRGRVDRPVRGMLRLLRNGEEVWHRKIHALPERRIHLPGGHVSLDGIESLEVRLDPS